LSIGIQKRLENNERLPQVLLKIKTKPTHPFGLLNPRVPNISLKYKFKHLTDCYADQANDKQQHGYQHYK
jgi:hypothetical protein